MQDFNRDFSNICISPRPSAVPWGKVQVVKTFEYQARQNICTINFSAAFNQVISECKLIMGNCRDSVKATAKWAKNQIQLDLSHRRTDAKLYPPERKLTKAILISLNLEGEAQGKI